MTTPQNKPGSLWRRWDPHIHAPGTVMNDQFSGSDPWEDYLTKIETSLPQIEALGITDYYSLDVYEEVVAHQANGRLEKVGLIFPNVELRYAVGTAKASPINFHLLISPDDPGHIKKARQFLMSLTYRHADNVQYRCTHEDIADLGRAHSGNDQLDDKAAFREGANQFKVEVDQFLTEWDKNEWMQEHALIAVAVGSSDGTSGLAGDASLASQRQKIEAAAHVIFSGSPAQRAFWLGEKSMSPEQIVDKYRSLKPCLHGSDAHDHGKVGEPDLGRYCWIKGDAAFESLRQTCMEPGIRVHIGKTPPDGPFRSQTIASIKMTGADWFGAEPIELNPGLVGVIGARGSGKTALADMIAAGAYALSDHINEASFVHRAREHLVDAQSFLTWRDGETTDNAITNVDSESMWDEPRVQYLSQQFVEKLCSAEGATDELITEIERVIFSAHPSDERFGANDFDELLDLTAERGRQERARHEDAIAGIGDQIAAERDKQDGRKGWIKSVGELTEQVARDKKDREKLVPKEAKAHATALGTVSTAADAIRLKIENAKRQDKALDVLADHVKAFREGGAAAELSNLKRTHAATQLEDTDWAAFKTDFVGDVDQVLKSAKTKISGVIKALEGEPDSEPSPAPAASKNPPSEKTFLPAGADLNGLPLHLLEKEEARLRALIGVDEENARKHKRLSDKITANERKIATNKASIEGADAAQKKIEMLNELRTTSYQGVFDGIIAEEKALAALYKPLSERLKTAKGALGFLTFSIRRAVDLRAWAMRGEELINKAKAGDFRGVGALSEAAEATLGEAWRTGDSEAVAKAMAEFRAKYNETLRSAAKADPNDIAAMRAWGAQVSEWLYSTDHIRVSYGMRYEGVEIETLSPGTRGIVLLLLYLAIDTEDDRPLIIDQPEENLDPKSIFDELVGLFRTAKQRRQIIIVTHNANLIVNTDADQVIVAECGPLKAGGLPDISYTSGALEDPVIRGHVCDILEGGKRAFLERAKRLRVTLTK